MLVDTFLCSSLGLHPSAIDCLESSRYYNACDWHKQSVFKMLRSHVYLTART